MTDVVIPVGPPQTDPESSAPPGRLEIPDFEIVPRVGLIFVGIALLCLIVAIAANKLWPLMFLHVGGGAAWTIIDLFLGLILGPIIRRTSVPDGSSSPPG